MKNYLVIIEFFNPYPKNSEYVIKASNVGLAFHHAFKEWRLKNKGVRVKSLSMKATLL